MRSLPRRRRATWPRSSRRRPVGSRRHPPSRSSGRPRPWFGPSWRPLSLRLGARVPAPLRGRKGRPLAVDEVNLLALRGVFGVDRIPPLLESDSGLVGPVTAARPARRDRAPRPLGAIGSGRVPRRSLVTSGAYALRRDGLVGLGQRIAAILFWPHPLVHRLNRRLSRLREEVCDDFVLRHGDPCRYARTLLSLAEATSPGGGNVGVVGMSDTRWSLEDRVARVLDPRRTPMTRPNRPLILAAAAVLAPSALRRPASGRAPTSRRERPRPIRPRTPPRASAGSSSTRPGCLGEPPGSTWALRCPASRFGPCDRDQTGASCWISAIVTSHTRPFAATDGGARLGVANVFGSHVVSERASGAPGPEAQPPTPCPRPRRRGECRARRVRRAALLLPRAVSSATTDATGVARFFIPADALIRNVVALKDGVGFDDFENFRSSPAVDLGVLPDELTITLDGIADRQRHDARDRRTSDPGIRVSAVSVSKLGKLQV